MVRLIELAADASVPGFVARTGVSVELVVVPAVRLGRGLPRLPHSNYACRPLVVLASCKSSTAGQQRDILQQVFDAWDVNCETRCGPLYHFFTDGDAPRRQAGEMMMTLELDKESPGPARNALQAQAL